MVPVPEDHVQEIKQYVLGLTLRAEGSQDPLVTQYLADSRFVASEDEAVAAVLPDDLDQPSVDDW